MLRARSHLARALVASALVFSSVAFAAQILEVYSGSLTTYLPTGKTKVQNVRPRAEQRGVNLDGSLRAAPGIPAAIAGNPFESVWGGTQAIDGVRLDTGTYQSFEVDIALPAPGFKWLVGRSFQSRQDDSGQFDSNGYMGRNQFQISQPELQLYDDADNAKDMIYLVYGADRYVEFLRKPSSSNYYKGVNGAAGFFEYTSGSPDIWTFTGPDGITIKFFGANTASNKADWQLWKITDPDNNTAYVGDSSSASTAVTNGFDSGGRIILAVDSADRGYSYAYSSHDSVTRLDSVTAQTKTGGTWGGTGGSAPTGLVTIATVAYTYYGTSEAYGGVGALKMVTLTTPLGDSGFDDVRKKHYRYYTGAYNASTNPGYEYALKNIIDFEGCRAQDWAGDSTFDDDFLTLTNDPLTTPNILPYASGYFEYDSSRRVSEAWFQGQCGCGGGADGTYTFAYDPRTDAYSATTDYDSFWLRRTVVRRPDTTYLTQYFDELGQGLSQVITNTAPSGSPTQTWVTAVTRDSMGCVTQIGYPDNVTSYTHDVVESSVLVTCGDIAQSTSAGLVRSFTRVSSADMKGFLAARLFNAGTSGSFTYESSNTWESKTQAFGSYTLTRPLVDKSRAFPTAQTTETGYNETDYAYDLWSGQSLAIEKITTTAPAVTTGQNGSNSSVVTYRHLKKDGTLDYERSGDDVIMHRRYNKGLVTKSVQDVDTGADIEGDTAPSSFATIVSSPLSLVTSQTYDAQGRLATRTLPAVDGTSIVEKMYYTKLADRRLVTLQYRNFVSGSSKYFGPVSYSVRNHAGKVEAEAIISVETTGTTYAQSSHIDEGSADPIAAVGTYTGANGDFGTISRLTTYHYNSAGTELAERRAYFEVPSSGAGTDSANYDPTTFGYDDMGRQRKVKEAHGTITRTVYDTLGRVSARWIGTNDSSFPGGESGTDNLTKVEELTYDSGSAGKNSLLTERAAFIDSSTSNDTNYSYDLRGNVLLVDNPAGPDQLNKYDNQNRVIARGAYSSTSSSNDPTSTTTNRLALSETSFDNVGRVWKTVRHKIDSSDGSDDDTLESQTWYDADGRVIKVDGEQLTKTKYDHVGRAVAQYTLASTDDTTYAHASTVAGDVVLEEHETTFDARSRALLSVSISRFHTDLATPTGDLDDGADGGTPSALVVTAADIHGRVQISANWFDEIDRVNRTAHYGTYGAATFTYPGYLYPPSASDTVLVTISTFNEDGTLLQVEDPKGLKTQYVYDDAGRRTKVIANYVNGTPGGGTNDTEDQVVEYAFVDGLQTAITAKMPNSADDQVTTYTHGVTKGAGAGDSKLASNSLLGKVQYPDSADSTNDVVKFAYNAQGQQIWKKDQYVASPAAGGNIITTTYDTAGRETARIVDTVGTGFDNAVRRIETAYTALGQVETVTQFDATSGGDELDQVKYLYDGWGNVTNFRQDMDDTVDASGFFDVEYAYAKATTGRNTIRRTSQAFGGKTFTLNYASGDDPDVNHENPASRVFSIQDGGTTLVKYDYLGAGQVVGTMYDQPDVMSKQYSTTAGAYPDLDIFNRVTTSKWTKDLATDVDFYNIALTYDRNSNITKCDEADAASNGHGHVGFDVAYTMDNLNRLTVADEGTLSGGSITNRKRKQEWQLTQTGNWTEDKLDLNGDGDWGDTDEWQDDKTFNKVNEITGRDLDGNSGTSGDNYTLVYDPAGNLTSDPSSDVKYEWDALYRLRKVKTQAGVLVAEYRYNGLGYRIGILEDTDLDSDVDGSDLWYYAAYDERWRMVATYRSSDTSPKERFVHHQAGAGGYGGSSYIDLVAFREKDANTAWTSASDGTLEERLYYCQNQHADVVALITATGTQREMVRYSPYGVPFGLPVGDCDSDGDCEIGERSLVQAWITGSAYDVRGDIDLDGDVDSTDKDAVRDSWEGVTLGRGVLSGGLVRNRRALAGYECVPAPHSIDFHARRRVIDCNLGTWIGRDPSSAQGRTAQYAYSPGSPQTGYDPYGSDWAQIYGGMLSQISAHMSQFSFTRTCAAGPCSFFECGLGWFEWKFKLSATAGTICNGGSGYIIQHLKVTDELTESCPDAGESKDFYEAFTIRAGDTEPAGKNDVWLLPKLKAVGKRTVEAEAKFVCKWVVGDLQSQWEDDETVWAPRNPDTNTQPHWWNWGIGSNPDPTDPNAHIKKETTFSCCGKGSDPASRPIPNWTTVAADLAGGTTSCLAADLFHQ